MFWGESQENLVEDEKKMREKVMEKMGGETLLYEQPLG